MSGSLNKVMLIGNLGRDPELKSTPSGQTVARFSAPTTLTPCPSFTSAPPFRWRNFVVP